MPNIIVVADTEDRRARDDRRTFQLKERVSASDVGNTHFSSQLIERIGWALADAEEAERTGKRLHASISALRQGSVREGHGRPT